MMAPAGVTVGLRNALQLLEPCNLQRIRVVAQCGSVGFSGTAVCRRNAGSRATGCAFAAQEVRYCRFILSLVHGLAPISHSETKKQN
jgi:hypothetical protein